jgi:hypothetical protein
LLYSNQLTGAVDLARLPTSLTNLWLEQNAGLTGVWREEWRGVWTDYNFRGTGITVVGA